jgi:hypothetical protein
MAKKKLTADMSVTEALALVASGDIPTDVYEEWDAARLKKMGVGRTATAAGSQISPDEFIKNAKSLQLTVDGQSISLDPRTFSTGSLGWNFSGKLPIKVGDKTLKIQASINLMVVGSKTKK